MKPLRVLIADDDGLTLMVMRKIIATMGHEVVGEAADGEQCGHGLSPAIRSLRATICAFPPARKYTRFAHS